MADPSGGQLQLPLPVLAQTAFRDFLVPGFVLFTCLGVFSFTALAALLFSLPHTPLYVVAEGILLSAWIFLQLCWTRWFHPLQLVMGATGILLIACGSFLYRDEKRKTANAGQGRQRDIDRTTTI